MSEVSKVQLGDEVLIDLTEDTVTEANLLKGQRAHGADGREIIGALIAHNVIDSLDSYSTEDGLSANQGRILNEKMPTEQTVADWGFTKNKGTYVLPADGIPKDDLSEDVKASLDKAESATTQEWVLNNAKDAYYSKGYYCHYHDMMYGDALFNISEEDYIKLAHYDLPVTITETSGDGSIRVITVDESNFNESTRDITIDAEFGVVINQKDFRLNTVTIYEAIPHEDTVRYWGFAYQDEIPTELSQLNGDSTHRTVTDAEKAKWNAGGGKVPTKLSELEDDATHRLVTDTEKSTWNGKADASAIPTQLSALADDSNHRLVTDAEKTVWDKASTDASDALDQIDTLGGDVSDVKESLTQYVQEGYLGTSSTNNWKQGNIEADGSITSTSLTRIYIDNYISVKPNDLMYIDLPSDMSYGLACYNASKEWIGFSGGWRTDKNPTIPSNTYFVRLSLRFNDNRTIYPTSAIRVDTVPSNSELKQSFAQLESNMNANNGDAWSSAKTYKKDEYCVYNNSVYKALVQNTNVLPTSVATWSKVSIGNELDYLNRNKVHCQKLSFNTNNTIVGTTNNQNYFLFGTTAISEGGFLYDFVWKQASNNANGYLKHIGTQTIISAEMSSTDYGVKLSAPTYVEVFVTSPYPFSLEKRD